MISLLRGREGSSHVISWFVKTFILLALIVILCVQLYQQLIVPNDEAATVDLTIDTRVVKDLHGSEDPIICYDRYGEPIRREEVRLLRKHKAKSNSFMAVGIPTIERNYRGKKEYYLSTTLRSLFSKLTENEKKEISVIIFCGDEDPKKRASITERLQKDFPDYIETGLIDVIYAPKRYYNELDDLPLTFNNSKVRVRWRGKQALDYSFMMYYASDLGEFYLHLEDDIKSKEGFYRLIKEDTTKRATAEKKWIIKKYFPMGFIGKVIPNDYLRLFANYWRMFYYEKPLDWLYADVLGLINHAPPEQLPSKYIFEHIGKQSSSKNNE